MQKIFDIHTHIYPEAIAKRAIDNLNKFYDFDKYYNFKAAGLGTVDDLISHGKNDGLCGALLLCVATNPRQVEAVNNFVAEQIKEKSSEDFKLVGFGCMHQDFYDIEKEADRIEKIGLKGIKIHPDIQGVDIDDKRLMPLYEMLEGRMPIYFHIGDNREEYKFSDPIKLKKIKKRFPRLEVVAAHLGGYSVWEQVGSIIDLDDIWFDTSSALWAMDAEHAKKLIRELGTKRVMFGTDYPVAYAESELGLIDKLELDRDELDDIFYNNAKRFLEL